MADSPKPQRLVSLDALRGFDMFWIIGGAGMVVGFFGMLGLPESWVEGLAEQMTHVEWDGFRFFDLIFPLFVFISGVTVPLLRIVAKGQRRTGKGITVGHHQTFGHHRSHWSEL